MAYCNASARSIERAIFRLMQRDVVPALNPGEQLMNPDSYGVSRIDMLPPRYEFDETDRFKPVAIVPEDAFWIEVTYHLSHFFFNSSRTISWPLSEVIREIESERHEKQWQH